MDPNQTVDGSQTWGAWIADGWHEYTDGLHDVYSGVGEGVGKAENAAAEASADIANTAGGFWGSFTSGFVGGGLFWAALLGGGAYVTRDAWYPPLKKALGL